MQISLKAARINRGITQAAAAQLIGCSRLSLGRWESGEIYPKNKWVKKICEVYEMCEEDLELEPWRNYFE